ncbi:hypothetical protein G7046_g460 [Stylonectria norvegica]|nr:hypothetical protein G7046_g460 [Stylonectria norvegica]
MAEPTPITEWPDYSVNPEGGDPITQDLNSLYDKACTNCMDIKGDLCWVLVCTILCWQITPAIGFLYAGMHRQKAALTMLLQSLFCACACDAGMSQRAVARDFKTTHSTVQRILKRFNTSRTVANSPRSGRPSLLTKTEKRYIVRMVLKDRDISWDSLVTGVNGKVSRWTIRRVVRAYFKRKWKAMDRPKLDKERAKNRLSWCQEWLPKIEELIAVRGVEVDEGSTLIFPQSIFSDESSIANKSDNPNVWLFRHAHEKYNQDLVNRTDNNKPTISLMFWGAITVESRSPIVLMERDSRAKKGGYSGWSYLKALEEGLFPLYDGTRHFQQDNSSLHTARPTFAWLMSHGVEYIDWPPFSPDLNPIENVWAILKRHLRTHYPHLHDLKDNQEDREEFERCVKLAWAAIPQSTIRRIIESMERRLRATYAMLLYQSRTTNPILGDLSLAGFHNVLAAPSMANSDIPDILYAAFGFTFVSCTAMILAGAMLERGRLLPSMVFLLCWTTFVYYILAYWEWNPSGWLYQLGLYDFAGSGPVHIASGFGALAWSMMLGPRITDETMTERKKAVHFKPHNPLLMVIGTVLIWFGWFAFNGASTGNLSIRSIYVVVNTNFAACGGGIGWVCLDYAYTRKFSLVGFCSGIISGLVGITPAAGFVPVYVSSLVGLLTSVVCFYTVKYKYIISIDDGLDIFAIHGIGGVVGDLLTGLFAAQFVPALDGVSGASYAGGWWNRNFRQLGLQLAGATTCAAWSFFVSCFLLFIINRIPGLHLRASEESETRGLDFSYLTDVDWEDELSSGRSMVMTEGHSCTCGSAKTVNPAVDEVKKD